MIVAQLAEPRIVDPVVAGSSPVNHPNPSSDTASDQISQGSLSGVEIILMFCHPIIPQKSVS